jgi:peptidyl-prolyl cis-trans isomerase C
MLSQPAGRKQFADDFLRMRLLASEGTKAGLQNDPEVINQLNLMRENLVATAELKKIDSGITVSDAEIQKAYADNANQYEQVKARHILIAPKGSPAAQAGKDLTDEQAKAKAEDLRKQIVAGANFEELAKKESDDTGSGARGGDLGSFGHNQMVPEFEQAAFAAKVGDVTPVVKTQFGYHIIQVQDHTYTPFEQVRATLEKDQRQKKVSDAIDVIKAKANPQFDTAYFAAAPATAPGVDGKVAPAANVVNPKNGSKQ